MPTFLDPRNYKTNNREGHVLPDTRGQCRRLLSFQASRRGAARKAIRVVLKAKTRLRFNLSQEWLRYVHVRDIAPAAAFQRDALQKSTDVFLLFLNPNVCVILLDVHGVSTLRYIREKCAKDFVRSWHQHLKPLICFHNFHFRLIF